MTKCPNKFCEKRGAGLLEAKNLTKVYRPKKGSSVVALNNVDIKIGERGMVFLLGKSGSGKSTLLNLLGGLDSASSGEIIIKGKSCANFTQSDFDSYRNTFIGFIFQEFNILEDYTVGRNIALSLELQHKKADDEAVDSILKQVGLEGYANRKPDELSGGQKQRVAIARALVKNPEIIMADEPTGALDSKTGMQVFDTLKKLSAEKLVLVVSHDRESAEIYADRIIELSDGCIISDRIRTDSGKILEPPVFFVSDKLIKISAGYRLSSEDTGRINEMLKKNESDIFVSFDEKANIDFLKQTAMTGGAGFEETTQKNNPVKNYDGSEIKPVKSRLPFKDSLRMGASGLKIKKARLAFTILLSFIAFFMFGMSNTIAAFNAYKTEFQTMRDNGQKMLVLNAKTGNYSILGGASYRGDGILTEQQIRDVEEITGYPALRFASYTGSWGNKEPFKINLRQHIKESPAINYAYYSGNQQINNLLEVPSLESAALSPATPESRLPSSFDEIAISDYMADTFLLCGYNAYNAGSGGVSISNYGELLGRKLTVSAGGGNIELKISGVFNTDINTESLKKYKYIQTREISFFDSYMFSSLSELVLCMGYVKPGFSSELESLINAGKPQNELQQIGSWSLKTDLIDMSVSSAKIYRNEDFIYWGAGNSAPESLADDETVLSYDYFGIEPYNDTWELSKEAVKEKFDEIMSNGENTAVLSDENNTKEFTVKGIAILFDEDVEDYQTIYNNRLILNAGVVSELQALSGVIFREPEAVYVQDYGVGSFQSSKLYGQWGYGSFVKFGTHSNPGRIYWGEGQEAKTALEDDDVIISAINFYDSAGAAQSMPSESQIKTWFDEMLAKSETDARLGRTNSTFDGRYYIVDGRKVKIAAINFEQGSIIVSSTIFSELKALSDMPHKIVIRLNESAAKNNQLMNYLTKSEIIKGDSASRLTISTTLSGLMTVVGSVAAMIKDIFFYMSLVFSIFAGLLLMNFIALSISAKKKDIGVLRAIGARSSDIFAIFLYEGIIIGIIITVLTVAAMIAGSATINGILGVAIFVPGFIQYLLAAALCLGVVVAATFIPVAKIAGKKPIDAINNR